VVTVLSGSTGNRAGCWWIQVIFWPVPGDITGAVKLAMYRGHMEERCAVELVVKPRCELINHGSLGADRWAVIVDETVDSSCHKMI
jgi:hypothetical protein